MYEIQLGEAFVHGHEQETAISLLRAAEEAGLDPSVVRTVMDGFVVPEEIIETKAPAKAKGKE